MIVLYCLANRSHQVCTALFIVVWLMAGTLLAASPSEAAPEGIPCTPEPTDMAVSYGDLVTCQITPSGDADLFRFSGSTGDNIVLQVTSQSNLTPCLELRAPDNTKTVACAYSAGSQRIDATLTLTGTYSVLVSSTSAFPTGTYALALEKVAPPSSDARPIRYSESLPDEINPIGDYDLFSFSGTQGDNIVLQVTSQSNLTPCLELRAPDNTKTVACAYSAGSQRIDATLTLTGTYSVLVSSTSAFPVGTYALDLQCVAGSCVSGVFPTIATTLTGCTTCSPGNTFSANASITNPTARWLEIKAGVYLPDRTPVNLLGNKHIELPPGFTFNGPVFNTTIPNGLPQGTYQFCGLLLERELGRSLAESCQPFTIGP